MKLFRQLSRRREGAGRVATLVLALPAHSEGGELIVRHLDRRVRLDMRCDEPTEVAFAGFYADCVHEVLPVTSGCRATLVFNLMRGGKGATIEPPIYATETAKIAALLKAWAKTKAEMGASPNQISDEASAALSENIVCAASRWQINFTT